MAWQMSSAILEGLKPNVLLSLSARLKSCPDTFCTLSGVLQEAPLSVHRCWEILRKML
jgi:hypothetical protein